jgi:DNA-binding IclR family transcriptional regulator
LLESAERSLNLNQICDQTGIARTTVYRILRTLSALGYLPQGEHGVYRLRLKSVLSTSSALDLVYPSLQDEGPPAS